MYLVILSYFPKLNGNYTMREWSSSLQKYVRSLNIPKFRKNYGKFLAEGDKICSEIISNSNFDIEYILATQSWIDNKAKDITLDWDKLIRIPEKELMALSNQRSGIEILIVANKKSESINIQLIKDQFSIFLDDVQDPGNLGSIIRIADWFGIKSVIRSRSSADFYNPKVVQASMGSFLRVSMVTSDFDSLYTILPNQNYYGTAMDGDNIFQATSFTPGTIIIGNEGRGIGDSIKGKTTQILSIPKLGGAESLNAAVACGIVSAIMTGRSL